MRTPRMKWATVNKISSSDTIRHTRISNVENAVIKIQYVAEDNFLCMITTKDLHDRKIVSGLLLSEEEMNKLTKLGKPSVSEGKVNGWIVKPKSTSVVIQKDPDTLNDKDEYKYKGSQVKIVVTNLGLSEVSQAVTIEIVDPDGVRRILQSFLVTADIDEVE